MGRDGVLSVFSARYLHVTAVGRDAGVVRGGVPREREERRHHVGAVGPGDPARDRHQQPAAPPQAAPRDPGDGGADEPERAQAFPHGQLFHHFQAVSFCAAQASQSVTQHTSCGRRLLLPRKETRKSQSDPRDIW